MNERMLLVRDVLVMAETEVKLKKVLLGELKEGEKFKIGNYDFLVLDQSEGRTKVISKDLLVGVQTFGESRDYNKSYVKKILEKGILPKIEWEIGAANIIEHEVELTSVDMQNEFGTCSCKVRPVTFEEARIYNNLLVNEDLSDWYWTLTPWSSAERGWESSIAVVAPAGPICRCIYSIPNGVRPVYILKSNIYVSQEIM